MTENEKISEPELIQALEAGDSRAFTTIYKTYWHRMFLVAYRKLQNKEVAEEIIQDIFTRLWKDRGNLKITSLPHYLFSAVRYEVIDHIRIVGSENKYREYYLAFGTLEDYNTDNQVAFNDLSKVIEEGLDILPEKSAEIFRLHKLENWPVAKIAASLNITEKAVEYHLTKATKSLRSYLNDTMISIIWLSILLS